MNKQSKPKKRKIVKQPHPSPKNETKWNIPDSKDLKPRHKLVAERTFHFKTYKNIRKHSKHSLTYKWKKNILFGQFVIRSVADRSALEGPPPLARGVVPDGSRAPEIPPAGGRSFPQVDSNKSGAILWQRWWWWFLVTGEWQPLVKRSRALALADS